MLGELRVVGLSPLELEKQLMGKVLLPTCFEGSYRDRGFIDLLHLRYRCSIEPRGNQGRRPLTVLEAVMKGGGFEFTRANLEPCRSCATRNRKRPARLICRRFSMANQANRSPCCPAMWCMCRSSSAGSRPLGTLFLHGLDQAMPFWGLSREQRARPSDFRAPGL